MKKMITLFLAALLVLGIVGSSLAEIAMEPRYSYTNSISVYLGFSNGKAECAGAVFPSSSYNTSVTVTLYKQNGNNWDWVASWTSSAANGAEAYAEGSTSVESGTYKVTTRGTIKDGNGAVVERPSKSVTKTK